MKFTDEGHIIISAELIELLPEDDYASPGRLSRPGLCGLAPCLACVHSSPSSPPTQDPSHPIPHLLFRVTDTGIGMDYQTLHNLFQRFYQGAGTMSRKVGGAGLGLAISAELVSLMGGTIGVHSDGVRRGGNVMLTAFLFSPTKSLLTRFSFGSPARAQNFGSRCPSSMCGRARARRRLAKGLWKYLKGWGGGGGV